MVPDLRLSCSVSIPVPADFMTLYQQNRLRLHRTLYQMLYLMSYPLSHPRLIRLYSLPANPHLSAVMPLNR